MQRRPFTPAHADTRCTERIRRNPQVTNGDKLIPRVDQRQALTHPGNDTLLLKQFLEFTRMCMTFGLKFLTTLPNIKA